MKGMYFLVVLLIQMPIFCQSANIIFVNVWNMKSHARSMMYLAERLVKREHNVTIYSQVISPFGSMGNGVLAVESQLANASGLLDFGLLEKLFWFGEPSPLHYRRPQEKGYLFLKNLVHDDNLHKVLNSHYDLVVVDELFIAAQTAIAFKLKEKFGSKIAMFSTSDLFTYASNFRSLSRNPATYPHSYIKGVNMFDYRPDRFYIRLTNMIDVIVEHFINQYFANYWITEAGKLLEVETSLYRIYDESILTFSEYPLRYGNSLSRSVDLVPIGEHCEESLNLPEEIKIFVEDPKSKGTIYVAFGSIVNWNSGPSGVREVFLEVFNSLKEYRIVWSYTGPTLPESATNIKVLKWAPQNDILAHPKTVLFLTHGGLKSLREGICSNTPLLFLPFFADQCKNAVYAMQMQLADVIYKKNITVEELGSKIRQALTNRQMKENVAKLHAHFVDNAIDSIDLGVFWTEKILKMSNFDLLKIKGKTRWWMQFLYVDLVIVIFVSLCFTF